MEWVKKGCIYTASRNSSWNQSHAQVPVIDVIDEYKWRIYYATRNLNSQSFVSYIEVEAGNPHKIIYEHNQPILPLGDIGTFDDSGIMPSSIINHKGKKYLYYIGWNGASNVSYRLAIGLAVSDDQGMTFNKISSGPIMDRSIFDSCLVASPFVRVEGSVFKMWYISGTKWEIINGKPEPYYHIKYASSMDGINWKREGVICIDYDNFTQGISRPSIIRTQDKYLIFYSFRNNTDYRVNKISSYRIGFASSTDGLVWTRNDSEIGIDRSSDGWDSEMIAYPYVIAHESQYFLFYNGNGFGKSGFGFAVSTLQ
jgi:hypothetical protein